MAWHPRSSAIFTGGSGQMAVIGELLHRKCNAAIPHVDIGMDVFAFHDDREDVARIQVKTAECSRFRENAGFNARFSVPITQLRRVDSPALFYALVVRMASGWGPFIIISRTELENLRSKGCGHENRTSGNLELSIRFRINLDLADESTLQANCGNFSMSDYINAWANLPPLREPEQIPPALLQD